MTSTAIGQTRNFTVDVAGAGQGSYSQTITAKPDGVTEVDCASTMRIKKFVISYSFDFRAKEIWQRGQVVSVKANRNDNGAVLNINAGGGSCNWTTSFYTLPAGFGDTFSILDLDTNTVQKCRLKYVGKDQWGEHWRVSGPIESDLWFDADNRLVRRTMLRKGRAATVSLIK